MLRLQLVKSLVTLVQMHSACYSSGLTRKQLLRLRADQKLLYGEIICDDTQRSTESVKKKDRGRKDERGCETAVLNPSVPSQSSEFYWLIQRADNKLVKIFRSNDVTIGHDASTEDRFNELPSNETL